MSRGPLKGRLRVIKFGTLRVNFLETNQSLFLSGAHRPENCTIAIPLEDARTSDYRAQGIPVIWPALMGYNLHLTDFDLKIPSEAKLATIVIDKEALVEQLLHKGKHRLSMKRLEATNQLQLHPELHKALRDQLNEQFQRGQQGWNPEEHDQLIETLIQCFEQPNTCTRPVAKREARHETAIELLHWCTRNPMKTLTVEELSHKLFQSRTTLFKGSQEHFGRTPLELQRSIRIDRVRHLLLLPESRASQGLTGVGDSAESMGFTSRSHFAKHYLEQYGEQPLDTLTRSQQDKA
ncbi:helix-turn-helix domain-containing protein [Synechococcus sp. MIT S9504]|uniref:helix-turn-helix domain-containing protein n=1 Tax=Synechococcus sp. MIT S9504 TaxID=1801628 RepID=UPI001E5156C9|nr:helix-turn-helix domain-containing protein [Synechococcus sp. MIT S9504]